MDLIRMISILVLAFVFVLLLKTYLTFHTREKRMVKKFAFLPKGLMSGEKVFWESYYSYQIYEAGFILDGEVVAHRRGKYIWFTANGSRFPAKYRTEFESKHVMGVRRFLKDENSSWTIFQREMRRREERGREFEKFFGKNVGAGRI